MNEPNQTPTIHTYMPLDFAGLLSPQPPGLLAPFYPYPISIRSSFLKAQHSKPPTASARARTPHQQQQGPGGETWEKNPASQGQ